MSDFQQIGVIVTVLLIMMSVIDFVFSDQALKYSSDELNSMCSVIHENNLHSNFCVCVCF